MRDAFECGQAAGRIRADIHARYLCLGLLNVLNWAALWFHAASDPPPERLGSLMARLFLEGALAEPSAEVSAEPASAMPLPRRRRPRKTTLDRLIDAAIALFSVQGYSATSTREVAALLGIQKASLYYHIESKEDLLFAICRSSLEQIRSDAEAALGAATGPVERIQALFLAHTGSMLGGGGRHQITFSEMHALRHDRLKQIVAMRAAYEDLVCGLFQEGQREGAVRADIEARYIALAALGLLNRIPVWYKRGGALTPRRLGQIFAALFLNGARSRPVGT